MLHGIYYVPMASTVHLGHIVLYHLLHSLQPLLVPLCFVTAWGVVGLGAWTLWIALRDSITRGRQMHRIPCAACRYFSGDYHLKCPVHPQVALSEAAIGCPDFEPEGSLKRSLDRLNTTRV